MIRSAQPADVSALAQLMADSPLWQRYGVTLAGATERLQRGLADAATIAVAECEGAVAGFVWYVRRGAFQRSGYIMLIGVAAGYQGQGIGRALLEHAEAVMAQDTDAVFLLVSDFNLATQRFYTQLGYRQVGAIPDYVIPGVSELIFCKRQ